MAERRRQDWAVPSGTMRREERARGRGEGARRLAWAEAEGAGLQDLRKGNEQKSTGSRREQKQTVSPWLIFESVPEKDELLDAAASRPYQNRGELRDKASVPVDPRLEIQESEKLIEMTGNKSAAGWDRTT